MHLILLNKIKVENKSGKSSCKETILSNKIKVENHHARKQYSGRKKNINKAVDGKWKLS
jgi:hypothetical protein